MPKGYFTELFNQNIDFTENVSLASLSSFKIGGIADCVVFPKNEAELLGAIKIAQSENIKFEIIGNASNILFSDDGYKGIIICTKKMTFVSYSENHITAQCGARLATISAIARDLSLSGLEFAHGIPGTVGGAVFMNAGAFGGEISDVVLSTRAINVKTGEALLISRKDHNFSYRHSVYADNKDLVCTGINFELKSGDFEVINSKMRENANTRREKQPLDFPSAGSYFKRPKDAIAAKLIDDCGLKGFAVGGACVSEKHAGFIVNKGTATASDVLNLEKIVRDKVFEKFGIKLEPEVKYVK